MNRALRREESIWFNVHFCYADDDVLRMFEQRERPYLVGALLSSPEYWNDGYSFLEADLTGCSYNHYAIASVYFLRNLVKICDDILDGRPIKESYSQFCISLSEDVELGMFACTLSPGVNGISGLPTRRIAATLGQLLISDNQLKLSFSGNGLQINMPAESRALYLLLLRHPEGIECKHLWRYQEELTMLYRRTSVGDNVGKLDQSIAQLLKVHDSRSRDNLKHCRLRCNKSIQKSIGDASLCKQYLITMYANKRLTIPIAKKSSMFVFPEKL